MSAITLYSSVRVIPMPPTRIALTVHTKVPRGSQNTDQDNIQRAVMVAIVVT